MSDNSAIEWTDASWTPIRARNLKTGKIGWHCEHATTGCINCYSEGLNLRLGTGLPFKPGHREDIEIFLDDKVLLAPLRWKKPRMIFVCSMTDLFADFVKDEWIDKLFAVMALCPQHTFQVLTKRAERMREYLSHHVGSFVLRGLSPGVNECVHRELPLPNVWLGVSCERQEEADERIPHLLQTPAAIRFVSAEPLLGPILIAPRLAELLQHQEGKRGAQVVEPALDWVIVGGESGRKARPMHPQWARDIRDQCVAAGVKFFFKQWGEYHPHALIDPALSRAKFIDGFGLERVGKKAAGRNLDGREWNEFPAIKQTEIAA